MHGPMVVSAGNGVCMGRGYAYLLYQPWGQFYWQVLVQNEAEVQLSDETLILCAPGLCMLKHSLQPNR